MFFLNEEKHLLFLYGMFIPHLFLISFEIYLRFLSNKARERSSSKKSFAGKTTYREKSTGEQLKW